MHNLHTFLDSKGHIHSGQVKEDIIEALRLHYFEYNKKAPDYERQVPPTRVLRVCPVHGPSVIGGQINVFLLQDVAVMHKELDDDHDSHRRLRDKTSSDLETETRSNK